MAQPLFIEYVPKTFKGERAATVERVNEILETYAAAGYDLTLRQVYYQFVSRGWIANRDTEYKRLGSLISDARLAGLVPWNRIVDRTRNLRGIYHVEDVEQAIGETASDFALDLWASQDYRVEIWVEKDALVGVIGQAGDELDVPYFSCRGYTSQSEIWGAAMRFVRYLKDGKRVKVLHLGDHDPSGLDMTRDIRDRLELFVGGHLGYGSSGAGGLEVERIALNMDQIEEYDPPPNPAKLSDSRGMSYVLEHGESSWELDALEPSVLANLIEEHVFAIRDVDLWENAVADQEADRERLQAVSDRWPEVAELLA